MDRGRQIDNIQNSNAVFLDRFGKSGKTSTKIINPPGGKDHFSLGWGDPEPSTQPQKQNTNKPRIERRKHPVKHRAGKVEVDKKIESVAKKAQARKLNEITEVNIFKDDNTVIQFKKPTIEYSFKEKVSFVSGIHETKNLKEVFTSLLKQLGPKQLAFVKETSEALKSKDKEKIDEAPELVEDFDAVAKGEGKEKDKKKKKKAKKEDKDKKGEDKKEETKAESDKPAESEKKEDAK